MALANPFAPLVRVLSIDTVLGGRVKLQQPRAGYRAAIDPILLAAAVPAKAGESILDVGCGVGTAGLCVAKRMELNGVGDFEIIGVDAQPLLINLANDNVTINLYGDKVRFTLGDIAHDLPDAGAERFDHVLTNPPYLPADAADASPDPIKAAANIETTVNLERWLQFCLKVLKPKGYLTMIHRADRIDEILFHLSGKTGDIVICPLWPKAGESAKRIIVQARKGSKTGSTLLPGLILHRADGSYTAEADEILQKAAPLALAR
jgi:tRNA1(Val) A37 N6-methylase TrmN6